LLLIRHAGCARTAPIAFTFSSDALASARHFSPPDYAAPLEIQPVAELLSMSLSINHFRQALLEDVTTPALLPPLIFAVMLMPARL
jgi:hypothetical protein